MNMEDHHQSLEQWEEEEGNPDRLAPDNTWKWALLVIALLVTNGVSAVGLVNLRMQKQKHWDENTRSYMLIQSAYQEGFRDCRDGKQVDE